MLMMMSNAFSGIFFPGYLCCEVHCLVKCQSAVFSVGAVFHLNALEEDFHGKYSSSVRHIKLFLMPLLL